MERKKCSKCGSWKELIEYQPRYESGKVRNECKACLNAYHRELYLRKQGKFKRDVRRETREADPKYCLRCKQLKPLSDFGWHDLEKGQHRNFCKVCQTEWFSQYRKGPGKPGIDEWKEKNKEKMAECLEIYRNDPQNKEKMRRHGRNAVLRGFGITQDDYDRRLQEQDGSCAICGTVKNGKKMYFAIDHNHETGKVRGLLCHNCNIGLGNFQDSPALLRKAATYLESFVP